MNFSSDWSTATPDSASFGDLLKLSDGRLVFVGNKSGARCFISMKPGPTDAVLTGIGATPAIRFGKASIEFSRDGWTVRTAVAGDVIAAGSGRHLAFMDGATLSYVDIASGAVSATAPTGAVLVNSGWIVTAGFDGRAASTIA